LFPGTIFALQHIAGCRERRGYRALGFLPEPLAAPPVLVTQVIPLPVALWAPSAPPEFPERAAGGNADPAN